MNLEELIINSGVDQEGKEILAHQRFYLSLEDNLMRIFASDKVSAFMKKMGMDEGESIEHAWVTKAIENAQKKVEGHNFDIRKHLLDYDDVANEQRKFIYSQRDDFLNEDKRLDIVNYIIDDVFTKLITSYISEEENNIEEFNEI